MNRLLIYSIITSVQQHSITCDVNMKMYDLWNNMKIKHIWNILTINGKTKETCEVSRTERTISMNNVNNRGSRSEILFKIKGTRMKIR